jgi:trans-aconitate 2-methyltransferase
VKDWDAASYHRLSEPQFEWGLDVLARVDLRGDERALDVGCGTGRLTLELIRRLPRGSVVALDQSAAMVEEARATLLTRLKPRTALVHADAAALPFASAFDLVFSTATFHWVPDHDRLFASLFTALTPGGRLVAQCGGGPNLARLYERADALMLSHEFAPHFADWRRPWNFANAEATMRRLEAAGFANATASTRPAPVSFPDASSYSAFIRTVCIRPHLSLLPAALHERFIDAIAARAATDTPAFTLDYWRLDLAATRP